MNHTWTHKPDGSSVCRRCGITRHFVTRPSRRRGDPETHKAREERFRLPGSDKDVIGTKGMRPECVLPGEREA